MEKKSYFKFNSFFLLMMCTIVSISAWKGHICTRKKLQYRTTYYCSCKRLWWCCGQSARNNPYYTSEQMCCPGREHNGDQNCNIPICIPPCQNGGSCVNPNECECAAGFEGDFCERTEPCSHLDPCYPGRCVGSNNTANTTDTIMTTAVPNVNTTIDSSMNDTSRTVTEPDICICSNEFGGETCLLFSAKFTPVIKQSNAIFTRRKATTHKLISEIKINVTNKTEITWTNNPQFNLLQCNIIATFDADELFGEMPNIPDYIRNTSYGIVDAHIEIKHTKIGQDGSIYIASKNNLTCIEATNDNPAKDLKCFKETRNDFSLSSGDVFSLRFIVISGGYRVLINTDYGNVTETQYYMGPMSQNVIKFRFDYDVPIHCSKNKSTCDSKYNFDSAMNLNRDITKNAITGSWSGWIDTLSGVLRYVFEVWKMEFSIDENGLLEPKIKSEYNPKPVYMTEIMADNMSVPMYEPKGPGVYSVILEINDRANNSEYVRRIAIYDKTSQIDTSSTDQLFVSSALSATDYIWQTSYSKDNITQIKVNWTGHFFNEIHEKGNFLAKILKYEARLSDPNNPHRHDYKRILAEFDDNEGARTMSAIPNVHAIVKFEIIHERIIRQKSEPSVSNWRIVNPLHEHDTIDISPHTIIDGYAVQVWVKAFDIMNHTKVDTTVVRFDQSPPDLYQPDITFNIHGLTSRITIISKDAHSGLKSLSMKFVLNGTGEVKTPIKDILVPKQTRAECQENVNPDCYCIQNDCFNKKFEIDFDNCKLTVPVDTINFETYSLHITTVNRAMLTTSVVKEIGSVTQFTGILQYPSPFNISIVRTTDRTITIEWKLLPTCYDRIRNMVVVNSDKTSQEFKVNKDDTEFTIPDLKPSSSYDIKMYSDYHKGSSYVQSLATPLASVAITADKPICSPPCQNGGACVKTNECKCAAGFEGDFCERTEPCSHLDPCYPGRCVGSSAAYMNDTIITTTVPTVNTTIDSPMNGTSKTVLEPDICICSNGFGGETCLLFSANFTPVIEQSNAIFTRRKATTHELISEYKIDATGKTGIDITWTNNQQFNLLQCSIIASFDAGELFGHMPNIPDYIRNTTYGIVNAHFEIKHTKINQDGSIYIASKNNLTCIEATNDNPAKDLKCFKETRNDFSLSSGDVYSLRFIVISGGYRVLLNTDYGNVTDTQYYIGPMSQNVIEFRFDYDVPIHCSKNKSTGDSACSVDSEMTLNKDITQDAISGSWSGWIDTLSGVLRYVFEVWKMEFSIDENGLLEPKIKSEYNPEPVYITEIMADNMSFPMYEPSDPGVYSVILEINDRANNSEYVRRIAIYDKTSQINTSETNQLFVSSAVRDTDYIWQTLYSKDNITQIKVDWTGHFFNEIHEKGNFLAKVLKYEARLSDPNNPIRHEYKRMLDAFDDNEGARTKSAIPNVHAIVKFDIIHENITRQKSETSKSNWRIVKPLQEHDTIDIAPHSIDDGYTVQVWVKAFDIMNHTKVDTTVVRFDQSPPDLYQPDITFNIEMLTSRITIISKDAHSGLKSLSMKFVLNSTGEVKTPIEDILVPLQTQVECQENVNHDCYCIQEDCFNKKFEIDFDNCKLTVPVETIDFETYSLHITTVNRALLTTSIVKEMGIVTQFTGIQQYSSPFNISIVKTTDRTITIQWKLLPTCYDRVQNVVVVKSDNTTKEFKVDKDDTEFTIPDLQPSSSYDIKMYSDYGNGSSYTQSLATPLASVANTADKRVV